MLLWLLFVGTLQASVASSYRGFWDGLQNHDASNFQHVPSDQSQRRVAFYQPKPNSLPWPQVLDPKHTPQMSSGQPCFHPRPQLPSYWPYPMPQSPHVPGAGLQPLQVPDPHLPIKPGQQPSDQPTPASQTQHPSQQPQAPGFPVLPPSNMPQASGPASKPPSRLLEYWYQKRPQHQSQSSTYPFNWPQGSNPKPQQPSAVPYPWYQQQSQQLLGNLPQPAPTTQQPSLPTNLPQAPKPQAQSQSKLFHPWYQQSPQQQSLGYLFKPQPWLQQQQQQQPPATQQPPLPSNLPQPPPAPSRNMPQTPQLTPATQQPDLSNNRPQAQPQNKLPHPWYQHLQYQSPIYLLNSEPYPWLPPQSAPSSNLPQASPSPSTTQQPALSTQLPQEPALSATPQPAPSSNLLHVHGPETQLSSRLPHPWYQQYHQYQSPSPGKPLPHPWLQVPGPLSQLPSAPQQPFNWLQAASAEAQPPSRPLHPWYQFWPPMHGYFPEPTNYRPYGPINLPNAWSWYRPQWPIYLPWTSYLPTMNSCKPPLLCYELRSNGGFYPDSTSSGES